MVVIDKKPPKSIQSKIINDENAEKVAESVEGVVSIEKTDESTPASAAASVSAAAALASASLPSSAASNIPGGPSDIAMNENKEKYDIGAEEASDDEIDDLVEAAEAGSRTISAPVTRAVVVPATPVIAAPITPAIAVPATQAVVVATSSKEIDEQQKEGYSPPIISSPSIVSPPSIAASIVISPLIASSASSVNSISSSATQPAPQKVANPLLLLPNVSPDAAKIFEQHKLLQEKLAAEKLARDNLSKQLYRQDLSDLQRDVKAALEKAQELVSVLISESNDVKGLYTALCQAIKMIPHYESELNTASDKMASLQNELFLQLQLAMQYSKNLFPQYNAFSKLVGKIRESAIQEIYPPFPVIATNPLTVKKEHINNNGFHLFALLRRNIGVKISYMCSNLLHLKAILSRLKKLNIVLPAFNVLCIEHARDDIFIFQNQDLIDESVKQFKAEIAKLNDTSKKVRSTLSTITTTMSRFEKAAKTNGRYSSDISELNLITEAPVVGAKSVVCEDTKTKADITDTNTTADIKTLVDEKTQAEGQMSLTATAALPITASTASTDEVYKQYKKSEEQLKQSEQALAESTKAVDLLNLDIYFTQVTLAENKIRQIKFLLSSEFIDLKNLLWGLHSALRYGDKKLAHNTKKYMSANKSISATVEQVDKHLKINDGDNVFTKFLALRTIIKNIQGVPEDGKIHINYLNTDSLMIYGTERFSPFQLILKFRHNLGIKISEISTDLTQLQALISKLRYLPFPGIVRKAVDSIKYDSDRASCIKKLDTVLPDFDKALKDLNDHSKKMKEYLYKIDGDFESLEDAVKTTGQNTATLQELRDIVNVPIMDVTFDVMVFRVAPPLPTVLPTPSAPPAPSTASAASIASTALAASALAPPVPSAPPAQTLMFSDTMSASSVVSSEATAAVVTTSKFANN